MFRTILLRRPPVLSCEPGPFVPEGADPDEVEARWRRLCAANPRYFDGRICHVFAVHRNGCGGAVLHVTDCAYRFYAVQGPGFDLGVRPLGVKGITTSGSRVLMGRRSRSVAGAAGQWELAPGGCVEPGRDPEAVVAAELEEETTLSVRGRPLAVALVFDPTLRCWEIVYRITPASDGVPSATDEYDELRWCTARSLPEPMSAVARQMAALLASGDGAAG